MVKEYAKKEIYNELERQFDKDLGLLLTDYIDILDIKENIV